MLFNRFCSEAFPELSSSLVERLHNIIHTHLEPTQVRPYHNINHISDLLTKLSVQDETVDHEPIQLAIWFHDLSYDAKATHGDNEENSAKLFLQFANEALLSLGHISGRGVPFGFNDPVVNVLHHVWLITNHQHEVHLFLDLDMSILAAPTAEYLRYSQAVRQECIHVAQEQFIAARCAFLNTLQTTPLHCFAPSTCAKVYYLWP